MSAITGMIGAMTSHPDAALHLTSMVGIVDRGSAERRFEGTLGKEAGLAHVAWARREYEANCVGWNERGDVGLVFIGNDFDLPMKARPGRD
jgi:hypothetical protein